MTDQPPDPNPISVAAFELSTIIPLQGRLLDEHAASFRWLVASLFAANGGGLVAIATADKLSDYGMVWSCFWFGLGILSSLLCGWFNQRMVNWTLPPVNALIAFWARVAHGMPFDGNENQRLLDAITKSTKRGWLTQASGWLAAVTFILGMIAAGTNILGKHEGSETVMVKVQH
jgi:hypothetical protein